MEKITARDEVLAQHSEAYCELVLVFTEGHHYSIMDGHCYMPKEIGKGKSEKAAWEMPGSD